MKSEIVRTGISGTYESSDIYVSIEKSEAKGIEIELISSVKKQFGEQIEECIISVLKNMGIVNATVKANDKGALDCVIKARTQSAAYRALGVEKDYNWEEIDKWTN